MMSPNTRLAIATAPRRDSKRWANGDVSWHEVCGWADDPADHKECGNYLFGELDGDVRNKDSIISRSALTLDADFARGTLIPDQLEMVLPWAAFIYTTFQSTPASPRYRVIIPLDRSVTTAEYTLLAGLVMDKLGRDQFDEGSLQPERYMFLPSCDPAHPDPRKWGIEGEPVCADELLSEVAVLAAREPAEEPKATTPAATTTPLPEDVVRERVAQTLRDLDELAALGEGERLPWPGMPDGIGWDVGGLYLAGRLVEAGNSGSPYTLHDAREDWLQHSPPAEGTYDPEHKWSEAVKHVGHRPLPYDGPGSDFGQVPRETAQDDHAGGWHPVDLTSYLDGTYTPPLATLMCRNDGVGLLYPGMTHSLHGESESGKSMIIQGEVSVRLKAGEWVCYLDYEADPGSVVERLRLMGVTDEQMAQLVYVQPETDHGLSEGTRAAFEVLLSRTYVMVVLDGVTEALAQAPAKIRSTGGLGGNDDITVWHDHLPRVIARRTGAAVVLIDHVAKGPDAGRFAIGGQAKMATMTGAAYLVRPRTPLGRDLIGEVDLYVAKDRHGYVRSKAGEYTKDRLQLVATAVVDGTDGQLAVTLMAPLAGQTGDDRLHTMMERVSAYVANLPPDHAGASLNLIRQGVTGNNDLKDLALHRLVDQGYVTRTIKGQANLHRFVRPFTPRLDEVET